VTEVIGRVLVCLKAVLNSLRRVPNLVELELSLNNDVKANNFGETNNLLSF